MDWSIDDTRFLYLPCDTFDTHFVHGFIDENHGFIFAGSTGGRSGYVGGFSSSGGPSSKRPRMMQSSGGGGGRLQMQLDQMRQSRR